MVKPHSEIAEARKPSIKDRQRQLREDAILDAAETLLVAKGYAAMTLDDLITEVGVSKPTLYQHFRSKDELIARIMTRGIRKVSETLETLEATLPSREALRRLIESSLDNIIEERCPISDLCLFLSVLAQEPVREAERELGAEIERLAQRCQNEGALRKDVPALMVAQVLLSIYKDWTFKDAYLEGRIDAESMKRAVVQMLLGD